MLRPAAQVTDQCTDLEPIITLVTRELPKGQRTAYDGGCVVVVPTQPRNTSTPHETSPATPATLINGVIDLAFSLQRRSNAD